jgi:hypothetical protein
VGVPPFEDHTSFKATYKRIAKVDLRIPDYVSREAKDLITKVCIPLGFYVHVLIGVVYYIAFAVFS